jgi:hypothetical protein
MSLRPIHKAFQEWLDYELLEIQSAMIERIVVRLSSDELYSLLVPTVEDREILVLAGRLLEPQITYTNHVKVMNMCDKFSSSDIFTLYVVFSRVGKEHNHILLPHDPIVMTNNDRLTQLMLPSLRLAQNWQSFRHVIRKLMKLVNDRECLVDMFPWLPDFIMDSEWSKITEPWQRNKFYERNSITTKTSREQFEWTMLCTTKRMRYAPGMTQEVKTAARLGSMLLTQYKLMKDHSAPDIHIENEAKVYPRFNEQLLSPSLVKSLEETKVFLAAHFERQKELRFERLNKNRVNKYD